MSDHGYIPVLGVESGTDAGESIATGLVVAAAATAWVCVDALASEVKADVSELLKYWSFAHKAACSPRPLGVALKDSFREKLLMEHDQGLRKTELSHTRVLNELRNSSQLLENSVTKVMEAAASIKNLSSALGSGLSSLEKSTKAISRSVQALNTPLLLSHALEIKESAKKLLDVQKGVQVIPSLLTKKVLDEPKVTNLVRSAAEKCGRLSDSVEKMAERHQKEKETVITFFSRLINSKATMLSLDRISEMITRGSGGKTNLKPSVKDLAFKDMVRNQTVKTTFEANTIRKNLLSSKSSRGIVLAGPRVDRLESRVTRFETNFLGKVYEKSVLVMAAHFRVALQKSNFTKVSYDHKKGLLYAERDVRGMSQKVTVNVKGAFSSASGGGQVGSRTAQVQTVATPGGLAAVVTHSTQGSAVQSAFCLIASSEGVQRKELERLESTLLQVAGNGEISAKAPPQA